MNEVRKTLTVSTIPTTVAEENPLLVLSNMQRTPLAEVQLPAPEERTTLTKAQHTAEELLILFDGRPIAYKQMFTAQWGALQRRFVHLWQFQDADAEEHFYEMRDQKNWSATTTASYWGAYISAATVLNKAVSPGQKMTCRLLNALAKEETAKRMTIPLQMEQLRSLKHTMKGSLAERDLFMAVAAAFTLGQRIGDTLRLRKTSVARLLDPLTNVEYVTLTYLRGKTTRRTQPYTLHIPMVFSTGAELWEMASRQTNSLYLFPQDQVHIIREKLKSISEHLCLLSIRKGGLQHLAISGVPEDMLLQYSRHTIIKMLHRYLDWGKFALGVPRRRWQQLQWQNDQPENSRTMSSLLSLSGEDGLSIVASRQ